MHSFLPIYALLLAAPFAAPATPLPEAPPGSAPPPRVKVIADQVNLRAAANTNCEVVAQVNFGDVLEVLAREPEWVKVRPPEGVLFWVHSGLVREGRVAVKVLNVRAGSSVNYTVVGQLERNAPVNLVTNRMEWAGLTPPEGTGVWIFGEYVEPLNPPAPPEPPRVAVNPPSPPVTIPALVPDPAALPPIVRVPSTPEVIVPPPRPLPPGPAAVEPVPPAGFKLVPLDGQGLLSTRTGKLHSYLLKGSYASRFRLSLDASPGIEQAVCLVWGNEDLLRKWVGKRIVLKGRDYWVQGEKLPVTVVEDIQPAPAGAAL